jgi:hypothetical protein
MKKLLLLLVLNCLAFSGCGITKAANSARDSMDELTDAIAEQQSSAAEPDTEDPDIAAQITNEAIGEVVTDEIDIYQRTDLPLELLAYADVFESIVNDSTQKQTFKDFASDMMTRILASEFTSAEEVRAYCEADFEERSGDPAAAKKLSDDIWIIVEETIAAKQ